MSLDLQAKHPRLKEFFTTVREYAVFGILAAAAFFVIFGVITVIQNRDQQTSLDKQLENTRELIGQVKALSEENKKLSQTAADYAYCNATILAKFTQTGDPITVEDLAKCKYTSYPNNGGPTSFNTGQGGQDQSSSQLAGTGNNSSNTNSGTASNSNNGNSSNNGGGTTNPPSTPPVNNPPTNPPPTTPTATPLLALTTPLLPPVSLYPPCLQLSRLLYIGKDAVTVGCR